jgi:hypothetical protein
MSALHQDSVQDTCARHFAFGPILLQNDFAPARMQF